MTRPRQERCDGVTPAGETDADGDHYGDTHRYSNTPILRYANPHDHPHGHAETQRLRDAAP